MILDSGLLFWATLYNVYASVAGESCKAHYRSSLITHDFIAYITLNIYLT